MPLQQHHPFSRIEIPGNNHPSTGIEIFATIIHLQGLKSLATISAVPTALCSPWRANFYILTAYCLLLTAHCPLNHSKTCLLTVPMPYALCPLLTLYCPLLSALCSLLYALCLFVTIRTPLHNLLLHRILRSKPGQVIATQWIISRANKTFVAVTAWPVRR